MRFCYLKYLINLILRVLLEALHYIHIYVHMVFLLTFALPINRVLVAARVARYSTCYTAFTVFIQCWAGAVEQAELGEGVRGGQVGEVCTVWGI